MEIWDLYDENRQLLGKTHIRGEKITDGTYHIVTDIWTVREDGKVLISKRHPDKIWGNMWECTGGSALAGESSRESAVRELYEELGIKADPKELELIDTIRIKERFVDTYAVLKNLEEKDLVLQDTEVIDAKFISFDQLDQLWEKNGLVPRERFALYRSVLKKYVDKHQK